MRRIVTFKDTEGLVGTSGTATDVSRLALIEKSRETPQDRTSATGTIWSRDSTFVEIREPNGKSVRAYYPFYWTPKL
jgi:hypothetical protein